MPSSFIDDCCPYSIAWEGYKEFIDGEDSFPLILIAGLKFCAVLEAEGNTIIDPALLRAFKLELNGTFLSTAFASDSCFLSWSLLGMLNLNL